MSVLFVNWFGRRQRIMPRGTPVFHTSILLIDKEIVRVQIIFAVEILEDIGSASLGALGARMAGALAPMSSLNDKTQNFATCTEGPMKHTVLTTFTTVTSALVFLLGTSFALPDTTAAQTASGDSLIAADIFKSAKPNDITVKKGLSIQSVGRQIGLKTLRNLAKVSVFVEQPRVRGGGDGNGGDPRNVLVNDPTLDNIQSVPGFPPIEGSTQNETSVAVFGQHVLVGYRSTANGQFENIGGNLLFTQLLISAYSISHDGGRTFTSGFVPSIPPIPANFGDPSVGVDRAGHFFYSSIGAAIGVDGFLHIAVQINRSDDNGNSFGPGATVALDDGADKDWLAIGPDPNVRSRDNLYITWTRFKDPTETADELWLSRSTDGGATWTSKPIFQPVDDGVNTSIVQWSNPVVDPSSGRLYVPFTHYTFLDADSLRVLVSDDGGETFHLLAFNVPGAVDAFAYPNVMPGLFSDCGTGFFGQGFRMVVHQGPNIGGGQFGIPRYRQADLLVAQPAAAAFRGRLFIALHTSTSKFFNDATAGSEINVLYSRDGGVTWAPPFKVAPSTTSDLHHVNPAVAVTQNGNRLLVSYYVQQIDERLRTDIASLHVDGNHLRLEATENLSSTAFNLTPSNNPIPNPSDPFATANYDLVDGACHVLGEYQSLGVSQNGDDSGPIVAAWTDLRRSWTSPSNAVAPGTHSQPDVFSARVDAE
jgi:hypothetical protein